MNMSGGWAHFGKKRGGKGSREIGGEMEREWEFEEEVDERGMSLGRSGLREGWKQMIHKGRSVHKAGTLTTVEGLVNTKCVETVLSTVL